MEVTLNDFERVSELNRGGFGQIYIGELKNEELKTRFNTNSVVVKVIMKTDNYESQHVQFQKEIAIMHLLSKYPYFAEFLGFESETMSVLIRLYKLGSLATFRKKISKNSEAMKLYTKALVMKLVLDISYGLEVMHQHHFAHCDIKPENILIDLNESTGEWRALLTDFGITRVDEPSQRIKAFVIPDICGASLRFAAPEILKVFFNKRPDLREFPEVQAGDIYALGCLLYELLTFQSVWR